MRQLKVIGISGNTRSPSRTASLVADILKDVIAVTGAQTEQIDLGEQAPVLLRALQADQLDDAGRALVAKVETADALVVGSPVYRASYTGALKHLFDLVHFESLIGKPVIVAATGGTPLHALMLEHQFRPLFGFFRALTMPSTIYTVESDFEHYALKNAAVVERIGRAVGELDTFLTASLSLQPSQPLKDPAIARLQAL